MSESEFEKKAVTRRDALKVLAAAAGAVTLSNLPNKWVKPVLDAGVLPAHAQTTPPPGSANNFVVKLFWADGSQDVDLILEEPDGTRVHPALDGATGTYTTWTEVPPREETTLTVNAPATQVFKVFGVYQGGGVPAGINLPPAELTFQVFEGTVASPATMKLELMHTLTTSFGNDGVSNDTNSIYACSVEFAGDGTIMVTVQTGAINPPL